MRARAGPEEQGSGTRGTSGDTAGGPPSAAASACAAVAAEVAHSFSGIGLWPRLVLHRGGTSALGGQARAATDGDTKGGGAQTANPEGAPGAATGERCQSSAGKAPPASSPAAAQGHLLPPIVVNARGEAGEPCRSHWQTVMPLLSPEAARVRAGDVLELRFASRLDADVRVPAEYSLQVKTRSGASLAPV